MSSRNNTSGIKGVSFNKKQKNWIVSIHKNGKSYTLGRFDCPLIAKIIHDKNYKLKEIQNVYSP
jgi:hypothetical protein